MFTGNPPFESATVQTTLLKVRNMQFKMDRSIPPDAADLIMQLLSSEPDKRLNVDTILRHPYLSEDEVVTPRNMRTPKRTLMLNGLSEKLSEKAQTRCRSATNARQEPR